MWRDSFVLACLEFKVLSQWERSGASVGGGPLPEELGRLGRLAQNRAWSRPHQPRVIDRWPCGALETVEERGSSRVVLQEPEESLGPPQVSPHLARTGAVQSGEAAGGGEEERG